MKIFVINLEQSVDRKTFMKKQLDDLQLPHEFFPAVDGRLLNKQQMDEMCNMEVVREWADLLTPGMIGCSLSHYNVYQRMVRDNIEYAFILEDDTLLSDKVPAIIADIELKLNSGHLSGDEPILLYYQSKEAVKFKNVPYTELTKGTGAYYPVDIWRPITTAAYVISFSCAQRLIDLIYPIRYSPDSWAVYHRENAIAGLRCVLPLPIQSGIFKSDIGYEMNKPLNRIVKYLEQKNIFPIKQLLKWRRRNISRKQNQFVIDNYSLNWEIKTLT